MDKITFSGKNTDEVLKFIGDKYITHISAGDQTIIQFYSGITPVMCDIHDRIERGESGDLYLVKRDFEDENK